MPLHSGKKRSFSELHLLWGDYCSNSRGGIIFSDVTLYICECNDSCGLHVEQLPKVQTSQVASLRNAAGVVEQSSALLVPHQK